VFDFFVGLVGGEDLVNDCVSAIDVGAFDGHGFPFE
jgi:hypothetical protein